MLTRKRLDDLEQAAIKAIKPPPAADLSRLSVPELIELRNLICKAKGEWNGVKMSAGPMPLTPTEHARRDAIYAKASANAGQQTRQEIA